MANRSKKTVLSVRISPSTNESLDVLAILKGQSLPRLIEGMIEDAISGDEMAERRAWVIEAWRRLEAAGLSRLESRRAASRIVSEQELQRGINCAEWQPPVVAVREFEELNDVEVW